MTQSWQDISAAKRKQRHDKIRPWLPGNIDTIESSDALNVKRFGSLTREELGITEGYDATGLLKLIATRKLSSESVTRAFCKRAALAQHLTNCLTEVFFEDGVKRAQHLDEYLEKHGKVIGPLHGLPISLKDSFNVKGYDSSLGVAALSFKPAEKNAALVDQLLSLGAVLYCKTNIPQTLSSLDSHNNVFGRTLNPGNKLLTAGGSSGGEGALLAMRGSVLGVGTDIGGSIRVPAMCNGIIGFKPSHGRIPYAGQQNGSPEGGTKIGIEPTAGPLARSVRDCELFLQVVADSSPHLHDSDVFAQTWQQQQSLQAPLRIGIIRTDGHTTPHPPVERVIDEVVKKLRSTTKVEVVELDATTLLPRCVKIFNGIMSIDGGNAWFDLLESHGEPLSPWLQNRLKRRPAKSTAEVAALQAQKAAIRTECMKLWQENGGYWKNTVKSGSEKTLDVIICPVAPHPVAPIDGWNGVNYTAAFNLLDYPGAVIPVRQLNEHHIQEELQTKPLNGWDKVNAELWTKVDRKIYLNSPLSIQIVARRLEERRLVESMTIIESILRDTKSKSML